MVVLPASVGGEPGIESYADLFESITAKVAEALR
jgi:hypothetical protein